MKIIYPPYKHHSSPKYEEHKNKAINMENVTTISIGRENYYPDNKGIPTLDFGFIGGNGHRWFLISEEEAEKLYNKLGNKL